MVANISMVCLIDLIFNYRRENVDDKIYEFLVEIMNIVNFGYEHNNHLSDLIKIETESNKIKIERLLCQYRGELENNKIYECFVNFMRLIEMEFERDDQLMVRLEREKERTNVLIGQTLQNIQVTETLVKTLERIERINSERYERRKIKNDRVNIMFEQIQLYAQYLEDNELERNRAGFEAEDFRGA
jgi:hypothetical protein